MSAADSTGNVAQAEQIVLHPMSFGELLDKSFRYYRNNFLKFFLIVFIIQAIQFLLQLGYWVGMPMGEGPARFASVFKVTYGLFNFIAGIVLGVFSTGALTVAVSETIMGRDIGIGSSYRFIKRLFWKLLGASILSFIIIVLGFIALIIPGVYFALSYCLMPMVVVIEKKGWYASLKRSRQMMRHQRGGKKGARFFRLRIDNYGKALLIFLLVFAISIALSFIVAIPLQAITMYKMISQDVPPASMLRLMTIIKLLTDAVVRALVQPFSMTAFVLLYYDIRIRREGFDLEIMANSLDALKP